MLAGTPPLVLGSLVNSSLAGLGSLLPAPGRFSSTRHHGYCRILYALGKQACSSRQMRALRSFNSRRWWAIIFAWVLLGDRFTLLADVGWRRRDCGLLVTRADAYMSTRCWSGRDDGQDARLAYRLIFIYLGRWSLQRWLIGICSPHPACFSLVARSRQSPIAWPA